MSMNKIYVGNLPFKTTEQDLQEIFGVFEGTITEIAMISDRFSKQFKGFAFITFDNQAAAQAAIALDGKDYGGRPMKVSMARQNPADGGGRGGDRGGRGGDRGGRGGERNRW